MTTLTIPASTLARIATVCLPHTGKDKLLPVFRCVRLFERDGHLHGEDHAWAPQGVRRGVELRFVAVDYTGFAPVSLLER